ncbi:MAG: FG-GAP-like repeat-containing protein, partial [Bacteroidota bacterium]|nr:FG-GAP-like repeat-containing protein [Bacteroidota bacterium]
DEDLAVFSRLIPFAYGVPAESHLIINEQCNKWNGGSQENKSFANGLVTSAVSEDMDGDGDMDIVASYEYGAVRYYQNDLGIFTDKTTSFGLETITGIWRNIEVDDIDQDGDMDIIACNHGLNSRWKASSSDPLIMYVNDFDRNGQTEQIMCWHRGDSDYPIAMKDDLLKQMPILNKKYTTYKSFATATIQDMFDSEIVSQSVKYSISELRSGIFYNEKGSFHFTALPDEAQMTTQFRSWTGDINQDGLTDLILGGNQLNAKPEMGINAASYGSVLLQKPDGTFFSLSIQSSGLFERGSIRDIKTITIQSVPYLLIIKNNETPSLYNFHFPPITPGTILQ